MPGMLHIICPLAAVVLAGALAGCTGMMRNAAREVTPAVVAGAAETLADPDAQRRIIAAIDEGRVKAMTDRLSAGVVDGVLDTLEDPVRRARLDALVRGLAATAAGAAADTMTAHALDENVQGRMRLAMRAGVADLIAVIFEAVKEKTGDTGDRSRALGAAVHDIARQATLGFQEALDDTRRERASGEMPKEDGALIIAAGNASRTGDRMVWTAGIGLAVLALGLAITLTWAVRKNRLRRHELVERDGALLLLTEAIKSTATRSGADELHAALKMSMRDRAGGEHIRKVLGEQGRHLLGIDKPA